MNRFNKSIQRMVLFHKRGGVFHYIALMIYRWNRVIYSCDIPPQTNMKSVYFMHKGFGVVINSNSIIGDGVSIQHGVTLGILNNENEAPIIENNVFIGAKATILGNVVIGEGAKIGAGSVVLKDVPRGATAVGVPARIIKEGKEE